MLAGYVQKIFGCKLALPWLWVTNLSLEGFARNTHTLRACQFIGRNLFCFLYSSDITRIHDWFLSVTDLRKNPFNIVSLAWLGAIVSASDPPRSRTTVVRKRFTQRWEVPICIIVSGDMALSIWKPHAINPKIRQIWENICTWLQSQWMGVFWVHFYQ